MCFAPYNGVHFFDIATSKSGPTLSVFLYILTSKCASHHNGVHFFRYLNFQKCASETQRCFSTFVHFCTFDLQMCFAPQRRAIFHLSSGQLAPHPAALASLLFDPPEPQIIGKNTVFRDFPTFSRICIFFLLTLSILLFFLLIFLFSLPLPCSAFHLSILSEV